MGMYGRYTVVVIISREKSMRYSTCVPFTIFQLNFILFHMTVITTQATVEAGVCMIIFSFCAFQNTHCLYFITDCNIVFFFCLVRTFVRLNVNLLIQNAFICRLSSALTSTFCYKCIFIIYILLTAHTSFLIAYERNEMRSAHQSSA